MNTLCYGPYLVIGVTERGITAPCSPTLRKGVNIAHKSLSVHPKYELDEYEREAANKDEMLEVEQTDAKEVKDGTEQSLAVYHA